jgi:hypothetical protein
LKLRPFESQARLDAGAALRAELAELRPLLRGRRCDGENGDVPKQSNGSAEVDDIEALIA